VLIIDPSGLFNGDRLRRCTDVAQLHWPRLFLASNGFGRLEINYARIAGRAYGSFQRIPSETELQAILQEYIKACLLFPYTLDGQLWGAWDAKPECMPRYKTSDDRRSPIPPEPAFSGWKKAYRNDSKSFPKSFGKISEAFPLVVVDVGVDVKTPLPPFRGQDVSLLDEVPFNTLDELSEKETAKPLPAHQATLDAIAASIHARHPNTHGRRDCGIAMVEKQLTAILKHKRVPAGELEQYLRRVDANHASMCESEQWQKDGGEYAKALTNWLAPTKERYDIGAPEETTAPGPTPRYVL
jgi:hypothetical protein